MSRQIINTWPDANDIRKEISTRNNQFELVIRIEKQEIRITILVFIFICPFRYTVFKRTVANFFIVIADTFGITNDRLDD